MIKKKKIFKIKFKNREFIIDKYIVCNNHFSRARGLMFRPQNFKIPLVFIFKKKGKYSIHSLFCRKFLAVWISDGKILKRKVVKPWKFCILPQRKFDTLIEIPLR